MATKASKEKGKLVGVWLPSRLVKIYADHVGTEYGADSRFGLAAIEEKLRREGALVDDVTGQVAAKASELADQLGADVVNAHLDQLAQRQLETVEAGK